METIEKVRRTAASRARQEAEITEAEAALDRARQEHRQVTADLAGALVDGHAAGASLRELAAAAGLAHQRVHQIVRAAH